MPSASPAPSSSPLLRATPSPSTQGGRTLAEFQASAEQAAELLKALANPVRLLLLCHLVESERSVAELGELSGIGQPSLSQHLGVLRGERLVAARREGQRVLYRIASPAPLAVLQTLQSLYCPQPVASAGAAGKRAASARRAKGTT
jgi:DNA-binding transcriptional ArsR family regulator